MTHGSWPIVPKQGLPSGGLRAAPKSLALESPPLCAFKQLPVVLRSQQGCQVRNNLFPSPEAEASTSSMTDNLFPQGRIAKLSILMNGLPEHHYSCLVEARGKVVFSDV